MNKQNIKILSTFVSILVTLSVLLTLSGVSASGITDEIDPTPRPTVLPSPNLTNPRERPTTPDHPLSISGAPGYCSSTGGATGYESITSVTLTPNPDGTMKLVVQVYIANPTGCTAGEPCPVYDNSPEYVNVWIDWDGDKTWEASEKVMDKALTGYLAINYHGTMTAISQFSPPSSTTDEPTWLRANLGWGYDPNDPCEEFWTWGNVVDQQVHLVQPEIKEITVQGVGTTDNEPETGNRVRLEADIDVPTGYEVTKCSWTGDLTPGEGDPANDCRYEYTPATGDGPSVNTYGEKDIALTIAFRHTPSGATGQASKDHTYKVFFKKTGDDDGDSTPNWFEYWGDDGAVPGLNAADVRYDSTCPAGYTCYGAWRYPPNDNVYVKDGAAETHYPGGITVPATANCPGGNFGGAQGIDCAAEVLAHELRHKAIYHNWDSTSSGSCGNSAGPWGSCTDSDTATTHGRPGDDLPDDYETAFGTDPNDVDSCNMAAAKGVPSYAQYGDNEFEVMQSSDGATGNANNDWANPGKQTAAPFVLSMHSQGRGAEPGVKSGSAGSHAPHGVFSVIAATALGSLTGSYSDSGVDTDADGSYNNLQLSVGVQIDQPTSYYVVAWLENGLGTEIVWASTGATLSAGTHTIDLLFDGHVIRASEFNGPYSISRVELRVVDDDSLADAADYVHTTAAYNYTDFESPDVAFTGSYSDIGVDTNADGMYNSLRVNVDVNVQKAGTYTIIGQLEHLNSGSIAVARTTTSLSIGLQTIGLDFDGQTIFSYRQNGPYQLKALRVEDMSTNRIDFKYDAYTTNAYSYNQFQHSGTTINAGSYSDQGIDIDGDGDYDYLRVAFQVSVDQQDVYRLLATLTDNAGKMIVSAVRQLNLSSGTNTINLDFPGGNIHEYGVNGPYKVVSLSLLRANGAIADYQQLAYTTQAYSYTSFSPLLVSSTGNLRDYAQDGDGDGLYGYLKIDVGVIPGDSGIIVAQGRLVDNTGYEIEWAESSVAMVAGIAQTITLSFAGGSILTSGRDGPYQLRDLLIYHTGDPEQGIHISMAHTTAAYDYLDFESEIFRAYLPVILRNSGGGYNWLDATNGGMVVAQGDDTYQYISLPFAFNFYGNTYTGLYVSSNGFVSFGSGYSNYSNGCIPSTSTPNNAIYAFWDDLKPAGGSDGNVYVKQVDSATFVVEWYRVRKLNTPDYQTFEIVLRSDHSITLQYQSVSNTGSATVGVENATGTLAKQHICNGVGTPLTNQLAIRYTTP